MSNTTYGVNDALAVKLWAKELAKEALKATEIAPLIGTSANSVIHRKTETEKGPGDKVTFGLRMQLSGDGVSEGGVLEGNEEALTTYSDAVYINELRHAVKVRNAGTIDAQRVPFNLRDEAKDGLTDWVAKRYSLWFFNQMCGYTPQTDVRYTGMQAATTATRIVRPNAVANDQSLAAADVFDLRLIDYVKEQAETAAVPIRPIMVGGEKKYVMYLHPYQVTDLRINTSTGQWLDIQKEAQKSGNDNPIFTGALGEYNGVVLRKAYDITQGVSSASATTAVTAVRRALFLGAQAAAMAFGQGKGPSSIKWVEELFDYQHELGISTMLMAGLKKTQFNSADFGSIVVPTYAVAHT